MTDQTDKATRGLYDKFRVQRVDGSSAPGGKHHGCEYFVLDLTHDPFAIPALAAYAKACAAGYPALSADLLKIVERQRALQGPFFTRPDEGRR